MLNNQFVKIYLLPFLFFALITSLVIFSWFRYGYLYGGGDVGIPSYDPKRILDIAKHIWWEAAAPGTTVPQGLTSVPLQYFQSALQNLNSPPFLIQATVFWILFFSAGFGMYFLGLTVFGKDKFYLAILAAVFYLFNPYMMVQIWHRFIHNAFFLSAALPFLFIFFSSWIKTGKYFSLLLFLLTNFIAVYLYGTLAFIATVLLLLLFISIVEILFPWKGFSGLRLVTFRTVIGIIAWMAIHTWWLLPVLNVAPVVLLSQHSVVDNLSTLLSISSQTIIPYSLLGINPFYLYIQGDFGKIFDSYFFRSLPWLALIFLVPAFIVALKNRTLALWPLLGVLAIFLAKGPTSPFGYPYIFGFSNFFQLGVLRNPFEKLGIYIPFAYAILLPLGIEWYLEKAKKRFKLISKIFIGVILFTILGVNLWPMWAGKMFGKYNKLAFIEVPDNYLKADEYIQNQKKRGRILHLPLTVSESVTYYYWKHGYSGVEPSQLIFKSLPSISHGFNQGIVDDALTALSYIFILPDSEEEIISLLQAFNTKFIVLHKDIQWQGGYLPDPQKLEYHLNRLNFLEKKVQFGDLIVYELKDEYFNPKLKLTDNIHYFIPSKNNSYWPWLLSSNKKADLLTPLQNNTNDLLTRYGSQLIVFPEYVYNYDHQVVVKENLLGEMPAAKFLPDSPLYLLIKLKEKIQYFSLPAHSKFSFKTTLAGKRLTESYLLKERGSTKSIIPQLKEYQKLLSEIQEGVELRGGGNEFKGEISINFILSRHLATLNIIKENASDQEKDIVDKILNQMIDLMKKANIVPYNQIKGQESLHPDLIISRFNLPISGKYELLHAHNQIQNIYPNNLKTNKFQINNEIKELNGILSDHFISYGMVDLVKGLNEISFNSTSSSVNLAKLTSTLKKGSVRESNGEIEITSDKHDPAYIEFDITPINGGQWYQLTFESWIKLGDKFKAQIIQDTDDDDRKNLGEKLYKDFHKDPYRHTLVGNFFNFYINPTTTKATIRLLVTPWDGCKYLQPTKELCQREDFRYRYEQSSKILFKSIKVNKPLNNPLFLRANLSTSSSKTDGTVSFVQKNATNYFGKINLKNPSFLVFGESYHPDWKLELFKGGKWIQPSQKFLANLYGNAWYIESPGDYDFKLEFTPEKDINNGVIFSTISLLTVLAFVVKQRLNR